MSNVWALFPGEPRAHTLMSDVGGVVFVGSGGVEFLSSAKNFPNYFGEAEVVLQCGSMCEEGDSDMS